jgi:hypothetical protein
MLGLAEGGIGSPLHQAGVRTGSRGTAADAQTRTTA